MTIPSRVGRRADPVACIMTGQQVTKMDGVFVESNGSSSDAPTLHGYRVECAFREPPFVTQRRGNARGAVA